MQLLQKAIQQEHTDELIQDAIAVIKSQSINWQDLINRAYFHRIIPSLYKLLSKLPKDLVPQEVLAELKSITQDNLFVQLRNLGEFLRINQILKAEGIRVIPFKGFWLAQAFYGSLGDRESVDIDLMIAVKDLEKVRELLFKQHYVAEAPLGELTDAYIKGQLCEYNLDYYQGEERVYHFEFHWRIDHAEKGMDMGMDDLEDQIIKTNIQGHEVEVFSPAANFLLALMHHGGKDQLIQLKQVQDLALMLQHAHEMDWDWIIQKAQKYQVEPLVWIGIRLAQELTDISIPKELNKKTSSRFVKNMVQSRFKQMQDEPEIWYGPKQEWAKNLFHFRT